MRPIEIIMLVVVLAWLLLLSGCTVLVSCGYIETDTDHQLQKGDIIDGEER